MDLNKIEELLQSYTDAVRDETYYYYGDFCEEYADACFIAEEAKKTLLDYIKSVS
jgi:hypothetical protein